MLENLVAQGFAFEIAFAKSEMGRTGLCTPGAGGAWRSSSGVGAPLAAGLLEEVIALAVAS